MSPGCTETGDSVGTEIGVIRVVTIKEIGFSRRIATSTPSRVAKEGHK